MLLRGIGYSPIVVVADFAAILFIDINGSNAFAKTCEIAKFQYRAP